jgi:hypothetical protein
VGNVVSRSYHVAPAIRAFEVLQMASFNQPVHNVKRRAIVSNNQKFLTHLVWLSELRTILVRKLFVQPKGKIG